MEPHAPVGRDDDEAAAAAAAAAAETVAAGVVGQVPAPDMMSIAAEPPPRGIR